MDAHDLIELWLIFAVGFAIVCLIVFAINTMESRFGSGSMYRQECAVRAMKCALGMVLAWAWPLLAPVLVTKHLLKTMQIAEIDTPVEMWKARQAKKIAQLEAQARADKIRIKELERECEIRTVA